MTKELVHPATVLLDAQGRFVKHKLGPFKAGEIEAWATSGAP